MYNILASADDVKKLGTVLTTMGNEKSKNAKVCTAVIQLLSRVLYYLLL